MTVLVRLNLRICVCSENQLMAHSQHINVNIFSSAHWMPNSNIYGRTYWGHMTTYNLVNIGSGNGLLPQPMFTYHECNPMTIAWRNFIRDISVISHQIQTSQFRKSSLCLQLSENITIPDCSTQLCQDFSEHNAGLQLHDIVIFCLIIHDFEHIFSYEATLLITTDHISLHIVIDWTWNAIPIAVPGLLVLLVLPACHASGKVASAKTLYPSEKAPLKNAYGMAIDGGSTWIAETPGSSGSKVNSSSNKIVTKYMWAMRFRLRTRQGDIFYVFLVFKEENHWHVRLPHTKPAMKHMSSP